MSRKPGRMLGEVLSNAVKEPATVQYPFVKMEKPFRAKLVSYEEKCIGCKICMKDCPAAAITITKVAEKQFQVTVELDKCIYCGQCVDSCPKKVLDVTHDFELAQLDRDKLKVHIKAEIVNGEPEPQSAT